MEKTAKIALRYPAQLSDRTLSSITMRRPTVGDMLDYPIKNGGLDEEAALVAALPGLRPEDLRELDMDDYERLQDQLLTFRGQKRPGRDTGERAADAGGEPVPADPVAPAGRAGADA